MNRDELLQTVCGIPVGDHRPGAKMIEATDGPDLVAHADVYWRRIIVHPVTASDGDAVAAASITITVAAVQNVCVDPGRRGEGWGRAINQAIYTEIGGHKLIDFAAVFDTSGFFARMGWQHPDGAADPSFLVTAIRPRDEVVWPDGRVEIPRW